ncbi:WD40 repeat-like protein [Morchella conica CCBAS932]|uniref:Probable cytosolic iron-sulfur protein assembly protein 1 n=1 Tax=Morchella conica CCBAS932 TaxID=1392247 RepID=A0A3N4L8Q0_9PEZI|nr:WD40 repeat-like protein [Morchella conica CCBAS932]
MRLNLHTSLPPHSDRAWSIAVHPTHPLLASASSDRTSRVSSLLTYTPLSTLDGGHKRSIRTLAWQPNPSPSAQSSTLATGSFDATAGIWHRASSTSESTDWDFVVVLDGHENEIKSVAWSAGGNYLATCSRDKTVWVWEELGEDNFETVAVLQEHTQDVKCVAWHPSELLLASGSYDDTIRLWREDVDDWVCCCVLEGHGSTVWCVQFEKKQREGGGEDARLVSCSDDGTVRVWRRTGRTGEQVRAVPSILRGRQIEETWVLESALPKVHTRAVYSVSWSGVSGRIVSCGGDGRIVVYEEEEVKTEWRVVADFEGAHGVYEVNCVAWSKRWDKDRRSDDEEIIVSCGDDGAVNVWELVE